MDNNRLERAFELFDNYNKLDPRRYFWNGNSYPQEYFFALQVHRWVNTLDPDASEGLLLASRCQHIGRWEIPRESSPDGKAGYLNWRSNIAKYHAETAGKLLANAGYEINAINRVQQILLKKDLKADSEVQTIENALCLVFLQFEYEKFMKEYDGLKVIRILQKTWSKMSQPGRDAALKLSFSEGGLALIKKALGSI